MQHQKKSDCHVTPVLNIEKKVKGICKKTELISEAESTYTRFEVNKNGMARLFFKIFCNMLKTKVHYYFVLLNVAVVVVEFVKNILYL